MRNRKERARRAELVASHRRIHGDNCPGYRSGSHRSEDLVAFGDEVLCRSCAGSKVWSTRVDGLEARLQILEEQVRGLVENPAPVASSADAGLVVYALNEEERW